MGKKNILLLIFVLFLISLSILGCTEDTKKGADLVKDKTKEEVDKALSCTPQEMATKLTGYSEAQKNYWINGCTLWWRDAATTKELEDIVPCAKKFKSLCDAANSIGCGASFVTKVNTKHLEVKEPVKDSCTSSCNVNSEYVYTCGSSTSSNTVVVAPGASPCELGQFKDDKATIIKNPDCTKVFCREICTSGKFEKCDDKSTFYQKFNYVSGLNDDKYMCGKCGWLRVGDKSLTIPPTNDGIKIYSSKCTGTGGSTIVCGDKSDCLCRAQGQTSNTPDRKCIETSKLGQRKKVCVGDNCLAGWRCSKDYTCTDP
jgi:hypothetical protein